MSQTQKYFLLVLLTGPVHMAEQLATNIEEFYMIRREVIEPYYSMFAAADADWASVLLITIVGTIFSTLFFALSAGGAARLAALACFGLLGAGEIHHAFEAIATLAYDPGLITALPYSWYGARLIGAVWREWSLREQAFAQLHDVEVEL
jgi:hypothetical protein